MFIQPPQLSPRQQFFANRVNDLFSFIDNQLIQPIFWPGYPNKKREKKQLDQLIDLLEKIKKAR